MIKQYVKNTHAETHTQYELEVLEVILESYSYFYSSVYNLFLPGI